MAAAVENDPLTEKVMGLAIEVHRQLGPGLLESAYEECVCYELKQSGLAFLRQVPLPVVYKTVRLDCGYRMDVVVENKVILELKTVERVDANPRGANVDLPETQRHSRRPSCQFQCRGSKGWASSPRSDLAHFLLTVSLSLW